MDVNSLLATHPAVLISRRNLQGWARARQRYRMLAGSAASLERASAWRAAAESWEAALAVASGANVMWCRKRRDWCLAMAIKPGQ